MQNGNQDDNSEENNEMRTVEIEQGSQTGSSSEEKSDNAPTAQSTFGPDISASDDDDNSDIGSFIMDNEIDDDQDLEPTKFLLPTEGMENANIPSIDPETHARLEALLEAAGIGKLSTADGKALTDPEVLRKLTSSVSCALDEAAQALHRMRAEQQGQIAGAEGCRSLAEACSDGDVPTVRKLLHEGGSVHETTEEGESLLSLACSAGYYELAQVLLAMKANVEDRGIKGDCTPLMEAASGGYVDIVKLLISHGADVNAQSSAGNTPLHYAACGGYEDVVQVLIEAGANVEQHNENGHTPLMESASAGHVGVARILLNAGAGINTHSNEFKESALTLACYKGHLEMVKFLLEAGADQEHKTDEMHTALMEASMDGHVEVARLLLDSGAQVNMPADSFESPLTLAACGGHVELASLLIERGANLEEVNDEGYTPLMEAAREGHEEMVALLLAHGADINAQTEETQETALTLACCGGFLDVADFLIKAGADYELGCSTPLMEAAQEGHLELVKYLLKAGSNVHAQTGTGDTALTYACENGHTDVAEVLLQHGAELEHESEGGRTPLMKAARAGYLCTVQFLISKGADVNRATSTNDHTVLSLACAGGHLAVVELLLAHGADFIHKLKDGSTMIIEAAKGGHTQVVKLLLEPPNRVLMNGSPELELLPEPQHLNEARVPTQGLGNIVPPSNPDSSTCANANFITVPPGTQNLSKKPLEKEFNIAARNNEPQILKNMQNSIKRSHNNNNGGGKVSKPSPNTTATLSTTVENVASNLEQEPENMESDHTVDVKATERLEAIINNVMANELDNSASTREEQILRKQQILQELQKVEKELQEKAQAQLILSAHHQLEQQQQQQQLHQVLQQGAKALQNKLDAQVKRKQDELTSPDDLTLEELCIESSVDPEPSNDLDKQISNILTTDGSTAVGQIVFPNIPYDGVIPVTSSQQVEEGSQAMDNKELWARNNGNTPKRNVNKVTRTSRNNQIVTSTTSTVTTSSSIVNGILTPDQENAIAQGIPQIANPGSLTLAAYKQQIQTLSVRQQQQQQQIQVQQQQTQTIQFPQLTLTPEQQEQLLQMLSQPNFAAQQQLASQHIPIAGQQIVQQQTIGQQISQLQPYIQQQLQQQPQTVQALPQAFIPQPLIQPHLISPQQLSQQQQQQLLQQQQQAQLLQQQLQQQIKQPPPVPPATMPKNQRPKRHLYNNQTVPGMQGLETITPPPSTPLTPNPSPASPQSISPLCAPVDLDSQTESNHDTALTLACHGGHAELVSLLLSKGADIEHRDKKDGKIPVDIRNMDQHSIDIYLKALKSGSEKRTDINLVIVGKKGAGKTSLVHRLFGEKFANLKSTNGIEIHRRQCKIKSDEWTRIGEKDKDKESDINNRIMESVVQQFHINSKDQSTSVSSHGILEKQNEFHNISKSLDKEEILNERFERKEDAIGKRIEPQDDVVTVRIGINATELDSPVHLSETEPHQPPSSEWDNRQKTSKQIASEELSALFKSGVVLNDKDENYTTLTLWDFAGDEEFYATHQTFLNPDAVYILVANLNDKDNDNENHKHATFKFWMDTIHCYGCRADKNEVGPIKQDTLLDPPVVFVGTHTDELQDQNECSKQLTSHMDKLCEDTSLHLRKCHQISNKNDGYDKFQKIREDILSLGIKTKTTEKEYPVKFIQLERVLHAKYTSEKRIRILSFKTVKELASNISIPITEEEELNLFLRYQHEIGNLVFFGDIPEYIVLDPQWLADAFKCIVTATQFQKEFPYFIEWKKVKATGKISFKLIKAIFNSQPANIREHRDHLLAVMEKFDIIINPWVQPNKSSVSNDAESYYYIPCMMQLQKIETIDKLFKVEDDYKSTCLCFIFNFLPPYLISHLIVSCLRKFSVASVKDQEGLFKDCCVFDVTDCRCIKLLLVKFGNMIEIQVWQWDKEKPCQYNEIFNFIEGEINRILTTRYRMTTVSFEKKWKCSLTNYTCENSFEEFGKKKDGETFMCQEHAVNHRYKDDWFCETSKDPDRSSDEQRNFARLSMVVLDILGSVLYDRLDLDKNIRQILHSRDQYDISSLYQEHYKLRKHTPSKGRWEGGRIADDVLPSHICIGDDIERIRLIRNEMQHSGTFTLDDARYHILITIIQDMLHRFDQRNNPAGDSYVNRLEKIRKMELKPKDLEEMIAHIQKESSTPHQNFADKIEYHYHF